MLKTQEKLLQDAKIQIAQYLYRSLQEPTNVLTMLLQDISGNGNLNWQMDSNKNKLSKVFYEIAKKINAYTLDNGDFRTYVLLQLVEIVYNEYKEELFTQFLRQGYNALPESIVASLSDDYSKQPPQNTNFPGTENTSDKFIPISVKDRLIPEALYSVKDID